jgi:hypothetical protein
LIFSGFLGGFFSGFSNYFSGVDFGRAAALRASPFARRRAVRSSPSRASFQSARFGASASIALAAAAKPPLLGAENLEGLLDV